MAERNTLTTGTAAQPLRLPADRLQTVLDGLVARRELHHAILAVETMDGRAGWSGAAGTAYPDGPPMDVATPYFIASIDKLYTATAILKLMERGQLDLDACISTVLPSELVDAIHVVDSVDRSDQITVRHLLGHTSGLADYLEDRPRDGQSMIERLVENGNNVTFDIADAMKRVREELKPHFSPQNPNSHRSRARYSDTNFLLLIAMIERLFERPLYEVYAELIFAPAGMSHSYFLGVSEPLAPTPAPAALWFAGRMLDIPQVLTSLKSIYSTAADQIASLRALLGGLFFDDQATLDLMRRCWKRFGLPFDAAAMRAPSWPIEYGLGMMRFGLPRVFTPMRPIPPVLGHTGSTGSWLFYCPAYQLLLAGTVDQATAGAVPFRTVIPKVLRAVDDANR